MHKNPLRLGDHVRMRGQSLVGEVVSTTLGRVKVAFKTVTLTVNQEHLERTTPNCESSPPTPTHPINTSCKDFSAFNPTIDLHGMSSIEALAATEKWIDTAFLLGHKRLQIIHGKGEGILRKAVRHYLRTHGQVNRVYDQHPYRGGSGVTWIELF